MNQKMIDKTYNILKEIAASEQKINYGQLYNQIGVDSRDPRERQRGSDILTEVNKISIKERDVMISSIVVLQEEQIPGGMYFGLAVEFGKLNEGASESEKLAFWQKECKKVYEAYNKDDSEKNQED